MAVSKETRILDWRFKDLLSSGKSGKHTETGLEMNENKGGEISLGVEFGACFRSCKCLHIGSTPAKVVFEIDIWDLRRPK